MQGDRCAPVMAAKMHMYFLARADSASASVPTSPGTRCGGIKVVDERAAECARRRKDGQGRHPAGLAPGQDDANVPQAAPVMDAAANQAVWRWWQQGLKNCLALLEILPSLRLLLALSNFKYYMTTLMMAW